MWFGVWGFLFGLVFFWGGAGGSVTEDVAQILTALLRPLLRVIA